MTAQKVRECMSLSDSMRQRMTFKDPMPCMAKLPVLPEPGESILHVAGPVDGIDVQRCSRCTRVISDKGLRNWKVGVDLIEIREPNMTRWELV